MKLEVGRLYPRQVYRRLMGAAEFRKPPRFYQRTADIVLDLPDGCKLRQGADIDLFRGTVGGRDVIVGITGEVCKMCKLGGRSDEEPTCRYYKVASSFQPSTPGGTSGSVVLPDNGEHVSK